MTVNLNEERKGESQANAMPMGQLPPFDPQDIERHGADAHQVWSDSSGQVAARCSLWWRQSASLADQRVGMIGHYAATSRLAGAPLLGLACTKLAASGCTLAVGPMDGSTWRPYRFVTQSGDEPAFFLEPQNPTDWPLHFGAAGFSPLAHYYSAVTDRLVDEEPKAGLAEARLKALGVELRPLDLSRWESELHELHRITTAAFAKALLYQPLPEAAFVADCEPLPPLIKPELVQFAMHGG